MKDKTAALDLFHDIEFPEQKEEPDFLSIESEQQDDELDTPEIESLPENDETVQFADNYLKMNSFPQLSGMVLPVWLFCPGIPLGVPVMALFPVLIFS